MCRKMSSDRLTLAWGGNGVRVEDGEINPTRSAGQPEEIPRFIAMIAAVLGTTLS
jgi:hypothetical protein